MEEQNNKRLRMNVSLTAKGLGQRDVTAEYDSPEEAQKNLEDGILRCRETLSKLGISSVESVEVK